MTKVEFPLEHLPAWCSRHGVSLNEDYRVEAANVQGKGNGLVVVTEKEGLHVSPADGRRRGEAAATATTSPLPLLRIPADIIVSKWRVERYAAQNPRFGQLLATLPEHVLSDERQLALLFMLFQVILIRSTPPSDKVNNQHSAPRPAIEAAWIEYMRIQQPDVPVPTMWSDAERALLKGTSLESATETEMELLRREFALIQAAAYQTGILNWRETLLNPSVITVRDWFWVDALFRSRAFDLPRSGDSLIPYLDLVNHSRLIDTAYWQQDKKSKSVSLLLRNNTSVDGGDEITINYSSDYTAAEMLFNYGFIDDDFEITDQRLVLPLDALMGREFSTSLPRPESLDGKLHFLNARPMLELWFDKDKEVPRWSSPFAYLLGAHEDDGLTLSAEQHQGKDRWRAFWRELEITDRIDILPMLIEQGVNSTGWNARRSARDVKFRVLATLVSVVERQLRILAEAERELMPGNNKPAAANVRPAVLQGVARLRSIERDILERSARALEQLKRPLIPRMSDEAGKLNYCMGGL
ncbi:hypothetical protein B0H66DRAFT_517615 [Apodospora peruviana]|uniref:SET domain-containing protein n=1 Tax=Apodospora peruviana TaxID=516989 RepID=A0AAE0I7J6_9PEZI|nr:hypothetical protein B0H66DRAFT_517615 [Apodospora peruviana]